MADVDEDVQDGEDHGDHAADHDDPADVASEVVVLLRRSCGEKALTAGAAGSGGLYLGPVAGSGALGVCCPFPADYLRLELCRSGFLVAGQIAAGPACGLRL
jgi:hypothetical protein